jgi:hypothetical protein
MRLLLATPPQRPIERRLGGLAFSIATHLALLVLLTVGSRQRAETSEPPALAVIVIDQRIPQAREPGQTSRPLPLFDEEAVVPTEKLEVRGLTFDLAPIRARVSSLFPFLTRELTFLETLEQAVAARKSRLVNPYSRGPRASRPPLVLTDRKLQEIIDRSWSRQHRWTRFKEIGLLVRDHDADHGRLPDLLHAYLDQNMLQPYYDGRGRDARFWVLLGLAADHTDFLTVVEQYVRTHPSTRTTTELLFLVEEFVQGSHDALMLLLATVPERDLAYTASTDRDAYRLALQIQRHYEGWLRDRQLGSPDAIRMRYDEIRLRLLKTIVESTPHGYRSGDARFLRGRILFLQGKLPEALQQWRAIAPDPTDNYVSAYSELLQEITSAPTSSVTAKVIAVLSGEHQRWVERSRTRLRRFGYSFDTF